MNSETDGIAKWKGASLCDKLQQNGKIFLTVGVDYLPKPLHVHMCVHTRCVCVCEYMCVYVCVYVCVCVFRNLRQTKHWQITKLVSTRNQFLIGQ